MSPSWLRTAFLCRLPWVHRRDFNRRFPSSPFLTLKTKWTPIISSVFGMSSSLTITYDFAQISLTSSFDDLYMIHGGENIILFLFKRSFTRKLCIVYNKFCSSDSRIYPSGGPFVAVVPIYRYGRPLSWCDINTLVIGSLVCLYLSLSEP